MGAPGEVRAHLPTRGIGGSVPTPPGSFPLELGLAFLEERRGAFTEIGRSRAFPESEVLGLEIPFRSGWSDASRSARVRA